MRALAVIAGVAIVLYMLSAWVAYGQSVTVEYGNIGQNPQLVDIAYGGQVATYSVASGAIVVYSNRTYFNVSLPGASTPVLTVFGNGTYLVLHGTSPAGNVSVYVIKLSQNPTTYNFTLPATALTPYLFLTYRDVLEIGYNGSSLIINMTNMNGTYFSNGTTLLYGGMYYVANGSTVNAFYANWSYAETYTLTYTGSGTASGINIKYAFSNGTAMYVLFTATVTQSASGLGVAPVPTLVGPLSVYVNGSFYDIEAYPYPLYLPKAKYMNGTVSILGKPNGAVRVSYMVAQSAIPTTIPSSEVALGTYADGKYYVVLGGYLNIIPATGGPLLFRQYTVFTAGVDKEKYFLKADSFTFTKSANNTYSLPVAKEVLPSIALLQITKGVLNTVTIPAEDVGNVVRNRILVSVNGQFLELVPGNTSEVVAVYNNTGGLEETVTVAMPLSLAVNSSLPALPNISVFPQTFLPYYYYNSSYYPLSVDTVMLFNTTYGYVPAIDGVPANITYNGTAVIVTVNGSKLGGDAYSQPTIVSFKVPKGKVVYKVLVDGKPTNNWFLYNGYITVDPALTVVVLFGNPSNLVLGGNASIPAQLLVPILLVLGTAGVAEIVRRKYRA